MKTQQANRKDAGSALPVFTGSNLQQGVASIWFGATHVIARIDPNRQFHMQSLEEKNNGASIAVTAITLAIAVTIAVWGAVTFSDGQLARQPTTDASCVPANPDAYTPDPADGTTGDGPAGTEKNPFALGTVVICDGPEMVCFVNLMSAVSAVRIRPVWRVFRPFERWGAAIS